MKNLILVSSLALTLTVVAARPAQAAYDSARSKSNGIGFVLGEPTGLSFQVDSQVDHSINGGLAWSWDHWMQIWVDYAFHFPHFFSQVTKESTFMDAYIGVGAGIVFADSTYYSTTTGALLRIPFGVEYKLATAPLGFFMELAPGVLFGPQTHGKFNFGIGGRFYF
ncbi:MAG: hypothetical protein JST80_00795 [Bdellovibrionales bacterium]|nr:hypothetical protein [Bdellovibrionales bacterium]